MELRQLEYFVAVADERNFTRAAAKLHVSQPGVSAQIRQLERELGHPLLDRSGRVITLTETGTAVLPLARAALDAANGVRLTVEQFSGLLRGRVAVGMVGQLASLDVPDLLAEFHLRHPAIEITLAVDSSDRLTDGIRGGRYDLAIIGLTTDVPRGLGVQIVVDEPILAAIGAEGAEGVAGAEGALAGIGIEPTADDAGLTGTGSVRLAEIADRPLVSLPVGTGLRACVDAAYASIGRRPRIGFEASDPRTLARLAARGLGLAFLPASVARAHADGLRVWTVTDPEMRGRLALVWRTEGPVSPAARALVTHACATLAPPGPDSSTRR